MNPFSGASIPKEVWSKISGTVLPTVQRASRVVKPLEKLAVGGSIALAGLPASVQAKALEPLLNHALRELIDNGEFDFLEDKCCAIAVRERNLSWHIGFNGRKIIVIPDYPADVTISASIPAFLNLVSQNADPDTLFFQRKLSIEGDVEMGLRVKNMLDALDQEELPMIWRHALNALKQLLALEAEPQS